MKSKVATKILQLAAIIRNGALIGADEADSEKWARELELAAKACEALRHYRENRRGRITLRALADDLGLSPSDLSAITDDGRTDGKAPDFVRLPATDFRLIEPEGKEDRDEANRQMQRFHEWLTSDEGGRTLELSKYDPTALWACWLAAITQGGGA